MTFTMKTMKNLSNYVKLYLANGTIIIILSFLLARYIDLGYMEELGSRDPGSILFMLPFLLSGFLTLHQAKKEYEKKIGIGLIIILIFSILILIGFTFLSFENAPNNSYYANSYIIIYLLFVAHIFLLFQYINSIYRLKIKKYTLKKKSVSVKVEPDIEPKSNLRLRFKNLEMKHQKLKENNIIINREHEFSNLEKIMRNNNQKKELLSRMDDLETNFTIGKLKSSLFNRKKEVIIRKIREIDKEFLNIRDSIFKEEYNTQTFGKIEKKLLHIESIIKKKEGKFKEYQRIMNELKTINEDKRKLSMKLAEDSNMDESTYKLAMDILEEKEKDKSNELWKIKEILFKEEYEKPF